MQLLTALAHRFLLRRFRAPRIAHRRTPDTFALRSAVVEIPAVDDGRLFAWWIPASDPSTKRSPAVIVLHGWGANAGVMLGMAPWIHQAGFHALFVDARCHGASSDADFMSLPRFAEDLESAYRWVYERPDVDQDALFAIGHSVGAGAVLLSASRTRWAGAVSLSAFAHPTDMMWRFMREHHIPGRRLGQWVLNHVQSVIGVSFDEIAPENTICHARCPVMLVHGAGDTDVPSSEFLRIASKARPDTRTLVIPDVGHDLRPAMPTIAPQAIDFIRRSLAKI